MKPKLYRVILPVNDIEVATKFYSKIFNIKGNRVSDGRHYYNLDGTILACYDPKAEKDKPMKWKFHKNQYIYIAVDNLKEMRRRVESSNCSFLGAIESMPWGETLFYAKDPFNNPICFVDKKTIFTGN